MVKAQPATSSPLPQSAASPHRHVLHPSPLHAFLLPIHMLSAFHEASTGQECVPVLQFVFLNVQVSEKTAVFSPLTMLPHSFLLT